MKYYIIYQDYDIWCIWLDLTRYGKPWCWSSCTINYKNIGHPDKKQSFFDIKKSIYIRDNVPYTNKKLKIYIEEKSTILK